MAELEEPGMVLTIGGIRWDGADWAKTGSTATVEFHGTDGGPSAELLRMLRKNVGERSQMLASVVALRVSELDFSLPNAPTVDDVQPIVASVELLLANLRALHELSPQIWDEDDPEED